MSGRIELGHADGRQDSFKENGKEVKQNTWSNDYPTLLRKNWDDWIPLILEDSGKGIQVR